MGSGGGENQLWLHLIVCVFKDSSKGGFGNIYCCYVAAACEEEPCKNRG